MTLAAEPRAAQPSGVEGREFAVDLDAAVRPAGLAALGSLGDAIRRDGMSGSSAFAPAGAGEPLDARRLDEVLPPGCLDTLRACRVVVGDAAEVAFTLGLALAGDVIAAFPLIEAIDDVVYMGPDSGYLLDAALRLAPRGERAADLGTGTGFLAAVLAQRYRTVVAADVVPRVVSAAKVTFALNRYPLGNVVAACASDVSGGLRPGAFDLVTANAPWVPSAPSGSMPRPVFAHGGETGTELPRRFLVEGASLLAPGGVAITLALDVTLTDGARPLRAVVDGLGASGLTTAVIATPINQLYPELASNMAKRQPAVAAATHVAVVVARPRADGRRRESLLVAADALASRWAAVPSPSPVGAFA